MVGEARCILCSHLLCALRTTLFAGQVEEIVHPEAFFSLTRLVFAENNIGKDLLVSKFENRSWFRKNSVILTGSPKLDFAHDISLGKCTMLATWRGYQHKAYFVDPQVVDGRRNLSLLRISRFLRALLCRQSRHRFYTPPTPALLPEFPQYRRAFGGATGQD